MKLIDWRTIVLALLMLAGSATVGAQETQFGKNKVQYKDFDWYFI